MTTQTDQLTIRLTDPHALVVVPAGGGVPVLEVDTLTRAVKIAGRIHLSGLLHGDVLMARIAGSTYFTLQHMQDLIHSSGWISGGVISDAGGAVIDVTAGAGLIRVADSAVAEVQFFDWAALAGTVIPADTTRYVGMEYNNGSPQIAIRTTDNWNANTDFELGAVVNEGGTLHIFQHNFEIGDHASQMIQRLHGVVYIARDNLIGGLILGESGVNKITMTAGTLWSGLTQYPVSALDTNVAGSFDRYYRDFPTGWVKEAAQTDWPNEEYDDGSGALATMTNNRYAVLWFYLETDGEVVMLYGRDQYTTAALAEAEGVPATVPDRLAVHGILIGRLIFKKSAAAATEISSVFTTQFAQAGVTAHVDLASVTSDQHHVAFVQADADLLYEALGDIATHAALDTGVHGAGGDVLATDDDIATHAALGDEHHVEAHAAAEHDAAVLTAGFNENLGAFYLDIGGIAAPANPGAGVRRLFTDTATGQLSIQTNAGATVSLEAGGVHSLLDGATHPDTVADVVTRGSLIYGNATPKWDEFVIGAADTVLGSDGADPAWTGSPSLSGTLTVDTINEFTAAGGGSGVTIEGLLVKNSYLEFTEIADPGAAAANALRLHAEDDDADAKLFYTRDDGNVIGPIERHVIHRDLTVDVVNNAAETTVYEMTVPANIMGTDGIIHLVLDTFYRNNSGAGRNLIVRVYWGGVVEGLGTITAITANADNRAFHLEVRIHNSENAAVQQIATRVMLSAAGNPGALGGLHGRFTTLGFSDSGTFSDTAAIDTTGAVILKVTIEHSAAAGTIAFRDGFAYTELI
jgi:hypothetical protein